MWHAMSKVIMSVLAVIFTAIAVKLTDDYLDKDDDHAIRKRNFCNYLGKGTPVYGLLALAVGASFSAPVSLSLFFSCYIIGMCHDHRSRYPLGLNGFQESLVVMLFSCLWFGLDLMLFSLLFVFAVQLIDDSIDVEADQQAGMRNFAQRVGRIECWLIVLICLGIAFCIHPQLLISSAVGFFVIYVLLIMFEGGHRK